MECVSVCGGGGGVSNTCSVLTDVLLLYHQMQMQMQSYMKAK